MSRSTGPADRGGRRPRRTQPSGTTVVDRRARVGGDTYSGRGTTLRDERSARPATASSRAHVKSRQRTAVPTSVRRSIPRPHFSRLGSQQVVSVRGRRVGSARHSSRIAKISAVGILLLIAGVVLAMYFSGLSTQQTFRIQQLSNQETQLKNQIETLNRDLEEARSATTLATRAGELGMVVPDQPGVLSVGEDGSVTVDREATDATSPILNVNSGSEVSPKASSDPNSTQQLSGQLNPTPSAQSVLPEGENNATQETANGLSDTATAEEVSAAESAR